MAARQTLSEPARDRSVTAIAHRLQSIAEADQIWGTEDGRVAKLCRYAELLTHGRKYGQLWEAGQVFLEDVRRIGWSSPPTTGCS